MMFWFAIVALVACACFCVSGPLLARRAYKGVSLLLLCVPVAALWLYAHWGAYPKMRAWQQLPPLVRSAMQEGRDPAQVSIETMQQYIGQHPGDAEAHYLLGKLYLTKGDNEQATRLLRKAHDLAPDTPSYSVQLAQALFFSGNKSKQTEAFHLAEAALTAHPHNRRAQNLVAIAAFERGDYARAQQLWRTMRETTDDPDAIKVIDMALERVAAKM